mgnify:CR=1 FL=1
MKLPESASTTQKDRYAKSPFLFDAPDKAITAALVEQLKKLPEQWALIPCVEKRPSMFGWERNHPTRQALIKGVRKGDKAVKKKWLDDPIFWAISAACDGDVNHSSMAPFTYTRYYTGFGIKSGEASGGLLLIDIDGVSAIPLLRAIFGLKDDEPLPRTVTWSSGKEGRSQMMFQVSVKLRAALAELPERFSRRVPMSFLELPEQWRSEYPSNQECVIAQGEGLDFRYDLCQSLLPPSVHPTTGNYFWINNPDSTPVMMLPERLEKLMFAWIELAKAEAAKSEKRNKEFERKHKKTTKSPKSATGNGFTNLVSNDLISAIAEADSRAGLAGFDWEGHQFQDKGNGWLEGYCPVHGGESGTSFQVEDNASANFPWRCHGCAVGGVGVNSYLLWIHTGQLKFKGHTQLIRKFLSQYGVTLVETCKSHDDKQLDKLDRLRHKQDKEIAKLERKARKESEFEQRKSLYFEDRNLANAGYDFYTEGEQYCSEKFVENMSYRGLLGLQAEMGKGKTTAMRKWLENTPTEQQFIFIFSRIALGKSQSRTLFDELRGEVPWIDDFTNIDQFNQGLGGNKIALCYDSLHKLKNFKARPGLTIVMDEVESGLSHLLTSDTHKDYRGVNIKTFVNLLGMADKDGTVLIADATLRKCTVNYIKQFMPISNTKLVINTDKPKLRNVTVTTNKKGTFEQQAIEDVQNGIPIYIATDSKEEGQKFHKLATKILKIKADDKKILRIDADTSKSERGQEAILHTNEVIERDKPLVMIATPSLANGISIECGHFEKAYFFGSGTVTVVEGIQQIARDREATEWVIFATAQNNRVARLTTEAEVRASLKLNSESAKEMLGEYIKRIQEEVKNTPIDDPNYVVIKAQEEMLADMKAGNMPQMQHEHSWYMTKIIADANWSKANFFKVMVAELERAGHNVNIGEGEDTATGEKMKECGLEIQEETAELISGADAQFTSYEIAKQAADLNSDPQIQLDGKKSLKAIITGLTNEEITKEYVMLDEFKRGWRDQIIMYFLLNNPEVAISKDMGIIKKKAKNKIAGGVDCPLDDKFKGNLVHYLELMHVKELIQILDLNNLGTKFSVDTPGLEEWATKVSKIHYKTKEKIVNFFASEDHKFPSATVGTKSKKNPQGFQRRYCQMAIWVLEKIGYKFEAKKGNVASYTFHPEYLAQTEEREKLLTGLNRKYNGGTSEQKQQELVAQITEAIAEATTETTTQKQLELTPPQPKTSSPVEYITEHGLCSVSYDLLPILVQY